MTWRSVWLVRHASTAWTGVRWSGRSDPPLTDKGVAEAEAIAALLAAALERPTRPIALLSSPSSRALETARAIGLRCGVAVEVDADLREVDLGRVDGLTFDEIGAAFPDIASAALAGRRDIDWPGGERASDLRVRSSRVWERFAGRAAGAEVVAVTHGGVIGELLRLALPPEAVPAGASAPATALRLTDDGTGWRLVVAPAIQAGKRIPAGETPGEPPGER